MHPKVQALKFQISENAESDKIDYEQNLAAEILTRKFFKYFKAFKSSVHTRVCYI